MKTLSAHDVCHQLEALGLRAADIVMAVGCDSRTVRRWRSEPNASAGHLWSKLDDLRATVLMLRDHGVEKPRPWLRARNPELNNERPIDILRQKKNGFQIVRKAIH